MLSACSYVYADKFTACVQNVRLQNTSMLWVAHATADTRIARETRAFPVNSRISARAEIISRMISAIFHASFLQIYNKNYIKNALKR